MREQQERQRQQQIRRRRSLYGGVCMYLDLEWTDGLLTLTIAGPERELPVPIVPLGGSWHDTIAQ